MNTQIEEAKKLHREFKALPVVEKQRIKWQDRERDPKLQQRAAEIIAALAGKKFDIYAVEATNEIYRGYFHQPALTAGYVAIVKGGKHTGEYTLKKDERKHDVHILKKTIENQDWLLKQIEAEATEKDKKITTLEAENKGLKKQLATLKKTSLTDK